MDKDLIISNLNKNSTEIIRVALQSYLGSQFLSIRCFYDADGGKGTRFLPTKKGLSIPLGLMEDLHKAVGKAIEALPGWSGEAKDE